MNVNLKSNFSKTCRACLRQDVELISVFTCRVYLDDSCVTQFEFCTKIKIVENDELPSSICVDCVEKVNAACSFIQLCQKSEIVLRKIDFSSTTNHSPTSQLNKNIFHSTDDEQIDTLSETNSQQSVKSYNPKRNQCDICLKTYRTVGHLKLHMKIHSPNDGFSCDFCEKKFSQPGALTNHLKKHCGLKQSDYLDQQKSTESPETTEPILLCRVCYKTYETQGLLNVHLKNDHSMLERLTCQLCKRIFKTKASLLEHLKRHMNIKRNQRFNLSMWKVFIDNYESNFTNNNVEKKTVNCYTQGKQYTCNKCENSFVHRSSLRYHLKKHKTDNNNNTLHVCEICNKQFEFADYLKRHEKIHNDDPKYNCQSCSKKFHHKASLNNHSLTHKPISKSRYLCCKCGCFARNAAAFKQHMSKHNSDELLYACDLCDKKFRTNGSKCSHQKVHTGVKKYKCSECPKRYVNSSGLKYHMRCHQPQKRVKVRPYQCRECDKAFETDKDLQIHIVLHTGEFPYVCEHCERGFNRLANYKMHMKRHSGIKSFICEVCGFAVLSATALKVHDRTHSGEKPYACDKCAGKFASSGNLLRHKKRLHADPERDDGRKNVTSDVCANTDSKNPVNSYVNSDGLRYLQRNTQQNISQYDVDLDAYV